VDREEELDKLIAAFGRHLHQEHPNPERAGCPEQALLARFADRPEEADAILIVDHIRHCAPCLDQLRQLRVQNKRTQR
jgi:type II secretory pathway component PulJ